MDYEWHESELFLWEQSDDSEEADETLIQCLCVQLLVWPLNITSPHIPVRPSYKTQTRGFRSKLVKQPRTQNTTGKVISEINNHFLNSSLTSKSQRKINWTNLLLSMKLFHRFPFCEAQNVMEWFPLCQLGTYCPLHRSLESKSKAPTPQGQGSIPCVAQ